VHGPTIASYILWSYIAAPAKDVSNVITDMQNLYPWQGANAIHSPFDSRLESQMGLINGVDNVIRAYTQSKSDVWHTARTLSCMPEDLASTAEE
jgi:hypothetical protein